MWAGGGPLAGAGLNFWGLEFNDAVGERARCE